MHAYINQDLPKVHIIILLRIYVCERNTFRELLQLPFLKLSIFISNDDFYFPITISLILSFLLLLWYLSGVRKNKGKSVLHTPSLCFPSLLIHSFPLFPIITPILIWKYLYVPYFLLPSHPLLSLQYAGKDYSQQPTSYHKCPTYFQLQYFGKLDTSKLTNLILLFSDPNFFLFKGKTSFTIFK